MKKLLPAIVAVSLLLMIGSAASEDVETEAPELKRLAGSYTLIGNQTDSATVIKNAIDAATAEMGELKKNVARKRLEAVNKVVTRLNISSV